MMSKTLKIKSLIGAVIVVYGFYKIYLYLINF